MAISALHLRRKALTLSSIIFNQYNYNSFYFPWQNEQIGRLSSSQNPSLVVPNFHLSQSRAFRPSNILYHNYNNDAVVFEGCDYNHWMITIDFGREYPRPTPEQMVETYVQTAARVFGSVEEAKKRIYACSTTTYDGFQVICSEDVATKFESLPGVVFVLPDSYIDPVNKRYGGDKYDNGIITHRPPPPPYYEYGRVYGRDEVDDRDRDFYPTNCPENKAKYQWFKIPR